MASSHIRRAKAQQIMPEPYGLYRALQPSHPRPNTRHVHGHRMTHGDTYCTCRCDTCTSHAHARHTRRTWSAGCSLGSGTPASASRQPRMVNGMTGPKAKDKVECRLEGSGWAARRPPLTLRSKLPSTHTSHIHTHIAPPECWLLDLDSFTHTHAHRTVGLTQAPRMND